jgi:hypothetical protein
VLQRFQSQRQSLAIMDHPAIAKVFDAGAKQDAQPFFVMEYVPASPSRTTAIKGSSHPGNGSSETEFAGKSSCPETQAATSKSLLMNRF